MEEIELPLPKRTNMDRRLFLKIPAGGLMAAMAASLLALAPSRALASFFPHEVTVRGSAALAARKALRRLGGMERFAQAGRRMVLKSNAGFAQFHSGAAHSGFELMREILLMCQEAGSEDVLILDDYFYTPDKMSLHFNSLVVCNDPGRQAACRALPDREPGVYRNLRGDEEIIVLEGGNVLPRPQEAENRLTALPARKGGDRPQIALGEYQEGINYELGLGYREPNQRPTAMDLYSFSSNNVSLTVTNIGQTLYVKWPDGGRLFFHPAHYCPGTYPAAQPLARTNLT
jgi:hypothetical protein